MTNEKVDVVIVGAGASGSGLRSGTKIADSPSSRAFSASPPALRARGRPRLAGLEPSSGAEISSSVLGGMDIGVFCKGCACLGSVQGVHDAVDL